MTLGTFSIALFPFWRLDAKGGEVVLFRVSRGFCMGWTQAPFFFDLFGLCPCYLLGEQFMSYVVICRVNNVMS